ncbi:MAG TPA: hypothetical protein VIQ60_05005 [Gemmatimonadaceae bacterium]
MRAVCISRHRILSDHVCSIFRDTGVECQPVVGFQEGMTVTRSVFPDVVICDYDLLVAAPLADWERDPLLSEVPIIAVSLTRRPEEAHLADTNGIAGFLYLPLLADGDAVRMVKAACARGDASGERSHGIRVPDSAFRWPVIDEPERVRRD